MNQDAKRAVEALIARSGNAYVASVDAEGFPNVKCMFARRHEGLEAFEFSTNRSSARAAQFEANPKASVYFCDEARFQAVLLVGDMRVCTDRESRQRVWEDGDERYYPEGVDDPDYCVLRFAPRRGRAYLYDAESGEVTMEAFELRDRLTEGRENG